MCFNSTTMAAVMIKKPQHFLSLNDQNTIVRVIKTHKFINIPQGPISLNSNKLSLNKLPRSCHDSGG